MRETRLQVLFDHYMHGSTHMHTLGFNPEGGLEATLTLNQQIAYLQLLNQPVDRHGSHRQGGIEFTTVTNHAEHLGLGDQGLELWEKNGNLTIGEVVSVKAGREKRRILRGDPRASGAVGGDGWGLCIFQENEAMAKAAVLALRDEIDSIAGIESDLQIFSGVEASVTRDGGLTIPDIDLLRQLDVVIASPHGNGFDHSVLAATPEELVAIYQRVIERYPILILGHPFNRQQISDDLNQRLVGAGWIGSLSVIDKQAIARRVLNPVFGKLLQQLRQKGVAFEFNLKSPMPDQLEEAMVILASETELPLAIGVDGHQIQQWRLSAKQISDNDQDKITTDQRLSREKKVGLHFILRAGRLLRRFDEYGIKEEHLITATARSLREASDRRKQLFPVA